MIAKAGAPQVYGEKLIKLAMIACAEELLGKEAASVVDKMTRKNDSSKKTR